MYYFSVQSQDGAGLLSAISSSNGQLVLSTTGIKEQDGAAHVSIYPNPFNDNATINYDLPATASVTITLTDALGKQVTLVQQQQAAGSHTLMIDKNERQLASGLYMLSIRINAVVKNYKLIVN